MIRLKFKIFFGSGFKIQIRAYFEILRSSLFSWIRRNSLVEVAKKFVKKAALSHHRRYRVYNNNYDLSPPVDFPLPKYRITREAYPQPSLLMCHSHAFVLVQTKKQQEIIFHRKYCCCCIYNNNNIDYCFWIHKIIYKIWYTYYLMMNDRWSFVKFLMDRDQKS